MLDRARRASVLGLALTTACATIGAPAPTAQEAASSAPASGEVTETGHEALKAKLAPYLDAFGNKWALLEDDHLIFASNREGRDYQLYRADARDPHSEVTRLVPGDDRIDSVSLDPKGGRTLFLRDQARDERKSLYAVAVDGSEPPHVLVAAEGDTSVEAYALSRDGGTLAMVLGNRSSGEHTLYTAKPDGSQRKAVMQVQSGFLFLHDLNDDASQATVMHVESLSRFVSYRVDLHGGGRTRVAPTEGKDARTLAFFGAEGDLLLITDEDRAYPELLRLDSSGQLQARYAVEGADVYDVRMPVDRSVVAVRVRRGAVTEVHLLERDTLALRAKAQLPMGSVSLGQFTRDGQELTVEFESVDQPGDVYAIDAHSGRVRPLRRDQRPGLDHLPQVEVTQTEVKSFDGRGVPVHVYRGANATEAGPVVVQLHGGPASVSSIHYNPLYALWISQGLTVVCPNIRGSTGYGPEWEKLDNREKRWDAFRDLRAVGEWARNQPWSNGKLGVYGGSYGGYLVYIGLSLQPDLWDAGVALVGPVNLHSFMQRTTAAIRSVMYEEFGHPEHDRELLEALSPLTHVDQIRAPLFVYQGENDPRVPRSESEQVVQALRGRGHTVDYMLAEREGHSVALRENRLEFFARATSFLERHL